MESEYFKEAKRNIDELKATLNMTTGEPITDDYKKEQSSRISELNPLTTSVSDISTSR